MLGEPRASNMQVLYNLCRMKEAMFPYQKGVTLFSDRGDPASSISRWRNRALILQEHLLNENINARSR